ncbi:MULTISPECIES: NAD(P)/FAD-dependent oxidoreductase [Sphingomonas]|jgi:D-arginine dehydrogenase|uniref:FAD-binding oxidoreductase n=1 Tax=Sphingomonas zeae TaxID=1646122 RepID=A0A7Y6EHU7_9SPHN|nr:MULTISPECIES: FAD-dependent oxidoreductase [Sphingomonas]MBB4047221.1 D-arginine dehydrogenase [Sphingomonas zeae]MDK8186317.1 FAD-dependent oxidoreductase [Sphingomonas zeae]MDK8216062.1 FAD-dependent oxidoreductase [Sphingomonas sp. UMB7805-LC452B]NUU48368.1 FAD-binding oxidoreductase [Sphingomonas zeae]
MIHDVAIVGAGMAGASLAAAIGTRARVVLLEAEDMPGRHATGRSAAFWSETYGGPAVQPLTTASGPALREGGYLTPLGSLHVGRAEDLVRVERLLADFAGSGVELSRVDPAARIPGLRSEWVQGVWEPSCAYIDVAALHADYLAAGKATGAEIRTNAGLVSAERRDGVWHLETRAGSFSARVVVNAAGAWADDVAKLAGVAPIGITPYRRTMVQLRTDPPVPERLPHVVDIAGNFYFKPEAGGRLWLTPHDETPSVPCDIAPEEWDVAVAIDRLEKVVDWRVEAVERRWAGLRSFAPDRAPVYGFDRRVPGFFWCAGQGGFGIQTAPAAAALAAALLLGEGDMPEGVDAERYGADRFPARG